jgi:hypothetical protein
MIECFQVSHQDVRARICAYIVLERNTPHSPASLVGRLYCTTSISGQHVLEVIEIAYGARFSIVEVG